MTYSMNDVRMRFGENSANMYQTGWSLGEEKVRASAHKPDGPISIADLEGFYPNWVKWDIGGDDTYAWPGRVFFFKGGSPTGLYCREEDPPRFAVPPMEDPYDKVITVGGIGGTTSAGMMNAFFYCDTAARIQISFQYSFRTSIPQNADRNNFTFVVAEYDRDFRSGSLIVKSSSMLETADMGNVTKRFSPVFTFNDTSRPYKELSWQCANGGLGTTSNSNSVTVSNLKLEVV